MKITFVVPNISIGGGVRVVLEYANRLIERGHEVKIVYPAILIRPKVKMKEIIFQPKSVVRCLSKDNKINWFDLKCELIRVPIFYPSAIMFFEHLFPEADVIVATSWETTYIVNKLSPRKGIKIYFVQHYEIWEVWDDERCWELAQKIETVPEKMCLAMADIIPEKEFLKSIKDSVDATYKMPFFKITISSWLQELIEKKMHEKVGITIINGVNFDIFYKEERTRSNNIIQILMPLRTIFWKGTNDGIEALLYVKKKYPNVEVISYGSCQNKALPSWIKLYENISDPELRKLYSNSDIFILPSFVEGCQLPPMEAMACGCAVVATNVGGVPDYSINEKTIITVPPKNIDKLAAGIIRLIENEDERKTIAEAGHNYIQKFTWDEATKLLEEYLILTLRNVDKLT